MKINKKTIELRGQDLWKEVFNDLLKKKKVSTMTDKVMF